jgi:hypothetical protein
MEWAPAGEPLQHALEHCRHDGDDLGLGFLEFWMAEAEAEAECGAAEQTRVETSE